MRREKLSLNHKPRGRLVVTRKHMQSVDIGQTKVTVIIDKGEVKLAIEAPKHVHILRSELEKHDKPTSSS